jgi:hypothetical protein
MLMNKITGALVVFGIFGAILSPSIAVAQVVAPKGWNYNGILLNDGVIFTRVAIHPKGTPRRIWARAEYTRGQHVGWRDVDGDKLALSAVALWEADCRSGKIRTLALTYYSKNNQDGEIWQLADPESDWLYAIPGSIGGGLLKAAC